MFETVVKSNPNLNGVTGTAERLRIITKDLFQKSYTCIARGNYIVTTLYYSGIKKGWPL